MSQNNIDAELLAWVQELGGDRHDWEQTELFASNARLYRILSGCAAIVDEYQDNESAVYAIAKKLTLKVNKKTDIFLIIVKMVFGDDDRRRVSSYATVLRKAHASQVTPDNLPDWITERGGVEAIRLDGKKRETSQTSRVAEPDPASTEIAPALLSADVKASIKAKRSPLLTIPPEHLKEKNLEDGRFVLMVGVVNEDKSLGVLSIADDGEALEAALRQLADTMGLNSDVDQREIPLPRTQTLNQALQKAVQAA